MICIDVLDRDVCFRHLEERKGGRKEGQQKNTSKLRAMGGRKEVG